MTATPAYLAAVVGAAVAVLLLLIIRLKQQPFVSLLLVSMATALAAGMPPETVMASIEKGMGGTLGFIAVVVGLGAMFGQLLEVSGGAERLTLSLLRVFGRERATRAMTLAERLGLDVVDSASTDHRATGHHDGGCSPPRSTPDADTTVITRPSPQPASR